jgi:hypothetical protein
MSGITRPVAGAPGPAAPRRTSHVLAQVGLTVLAALLTALVVLATSTVVDRWA